MADSENEVRLPTLYRPSTAGELLTPQTISKLMLGFTAGLGMSIAMQEATGERYDLWGEPPRYWCGFCRRLRRGLNKEQACVEWDKTVAQVLLGKKPEEYPGQAKEFRDIFRCHAGMLDFAEVIHVAGQPLAVLHGGQLVPVEDSSWIQTVKDRLAKPPLGLPQTEIDDLILLAMEDDKFVMTQAQLDSRVALFRQFALELETLLDNLYNERRLASEEALLHAVASPLHLPEAPTWEILWLALKELFVELCTVTELRQLDWFMGTEQNRFRLTARTGAVPEWKERTLSIGPFWEELSRCAGWTAGRRWDANIRKALGVPEDHSCAIYPLVCVFGTPARNIPAMLVAVSRTVDSKALSRFLSRLANESERGIVTAIGEIEKKRVTKAIAAQGAYVGHDMKIPLQVMVNVIPAIDLHLRRSGIADRKLNSLVETLTNSVKSAQDTAAELERMPVREFVVKPKLKRCDLFPLVDGIIALVNRLGVRRDISVRWMAHPDKPIYCNLDRRYMDVALHAVFDNAVKYSFRGTEVRIWLQVTSSQTAELRVSNLGIGIPPERKITIFEFGLRGEVEDKHFKRSGAGLGLPFVKSIIEAHKGSIEIRSHSTLTLPPEKDDYLSHVVDVIIYLPLERSI
jgi:signal transduction histidine kinase